MCRRKRLQQERQRSNDISEKLYSPYADEQACVF